MIIPFPEFMPDQPDYGGPGTDTAFNVLPRTAKSYGPMPAFASYASSSLTARCQGALSTLDKDGAVSIFAGDINNLYRLASGSTAFSTVSKSASPYNCPSQGRWSMCQFGQQALACNLNDPIQTWTLGVSAAFADLAGTPPKAKHIVSVKNFVLLGFTNDAVSGVQPQRVWWSGINDSTSWLTPGTSAALAVQSDYQDTPGEHGWLMGLVPNLGFADCALFFERAVYRMQYVGAPYFFAFAPAEKVRGTSAPGSLVQLGAMVYYIGEDGFYAFDGNTSTPIGALKIDKTFLDLVDPNYLDRISGAVDPVRKIVYWAVPSAGQGGVCDRIVAYHTVLDRFSMVTGQVVELLFRALSIGYTLEQLSPGLYASMELIPFPIDSRVWTGGATLLGAFNSSHTLGFYNGANLAPTLDTGEAPLFDGRRGRVSSVRPLVDGGSPSITVRHRLRPMDALIDETPVAMNVLGDCPVDVDDRVMRFRMTLPAGSTFEHAMGVDASATPSGTS